ncbi:MAG: hypothetical protein LBH55_00270, partial [Mycoplasmataceae bacterium]|nr:hypothetical protein [Mycoplasmataceae bacterium]
ENHVQNNFKSNIWKELVYTDITYIKSPFATSGNFYLNAFIDGFNNEVTGMVISETPSTEFVCTSLQLLPLIY